MQVTELIMKNYDLAQSLQMKIVKDPSVRPAHEHPPPPVMESTTTVTADHECTIQNQQTPKQNQQNPPVKISSGKASQEIKQQHQQTQKKSKASKTGTETKQSNNVNRNKNEVRSNNSNSPSQNKIKMAVIMLRSPEWKGS